MLTQDQTGHSLWDGQLSQIFIMHNSTWICQNITDSTDFYEMQSSEHAYNYYESNVFT